MWCHAFVLFVIGITVNAVEKPGQCPSVVPTEVVQSFDNCTSDFACTGSQKCCNGTCSEPVCDSGLAVSNCTANPCDSLTCFSGAQCFVDVCSEGCKTVWLTRFRNVSWKCNNSKFNSTKGKKKKWMKSKKRMQWLQRRCAKLSRKGKNARMCKHLQAANMPLSEDKKRTKKIWKKKMAKKQQKRPRKHKFKTMTPEEKKEFLAAKRQRMIDRLANKDGMADRKKAKLEKKLQKLERKQVAV